ncbi:MAG: HAMP domain-containing protein [Proteobacteria bacterium]|nr:HAMP domain-containing protein [Pseudomonadota bacterium]MBU4009964.1 HAMP domain-containing protein [Pseudomonadota bacterium]MBU4036254.1 HAMP domain-containing protein [Pseudomonadota bacterium]
MTVRNRLTIVTILGLAITMSAWGWIQVRALDKILTDHQIKRIDTVGDTVITYYQSFPTRRGLSVLDKALKEQVQSDVNLARIDIFSVINGDVEYIAGANRVQYNWSETLVESVAEKLIPCHIKLNTEMGPALGLLTSDIMPGKDKKNRVVVCVIAFSQDNTEILNRARHLLIISSAGLLFLILLVLYLSYGWIIRRPLRRIIGAIDEFQAGQYSRRIKLNRRDEWKQLANHFNSMADKIEHVLAQYQELNLSLEKKIQDATHNVVQLQKEVNHLQQLTALGYLTANLAHELGTPLHSIAGMARLLLESGKWPPDVGHKLELIVLQTQRLDTVIQNVRRATRLPEPHFETLSINELLSETLPLIEPLILKSDIRFSVNVEENIPSLYVDRYRFQIAILNLIENAVEAMPKKGEISISASVLPDGRFITISVKDNGSGIPPELIEKVREPFFSTHNDERMRGLGLAIVNGIAAKVHGGRLEIKSSPDIGTEIILYFPVVDAVSGKVAPYNNLSLSNP